MDSPAQAGVIALDGRESRLDRNERIFQSLPPLASPEYLSLLKSATRDELPAGVLVRAYRQLVPSHAADATLERLVDRDGRHGYLAALRAAARRRTPRLGAYTADDLVSNTIGEIVATLGGAKGKIAESAWALYVQQCMEDAYRELVGRHGERLGSHAATWREPESDRSEPMSAESHLAALWQARVAPSRLEWLEHFVVLTFAQITDERMRAVALDLVSHTPMPVSSNDPKDPNTLTGRFGVTRYVIYRWQAAARALLYDALEAQDECEIDMSFLTFAA